MTLAAGQSLAHYQILGPLGAGGMGEVYRARDTRLEREVAIKVLPEELADDAERLRRFEREAKALASLNHPNVAQVFGIDQIDDTCFMAMELVPGEDLAVRLSRGPLPAPEALDVCRQVAEGLEAAHRAGVIHRDLKPANVVLTREGRVKVLDFGLAKVLGEDSTLGSAEASEAPPMTQEGHALGTLPYMSPEQARGEPIDRSSDVWALGCVLYECLTGARPFRGRSAADVLAAILHEDPDWRALPAKTPAGVRALLKHALAKEPSARLQDAGETRRRLEEAERGAAGPGALPRRLVSVIGVLAVLAIALRVAGVLGSGEGGDAPVGAPGPKGAVSVAVLPFQNLSGDPDTQPFIDGLHEDLITRLSSVEGLTVLSKRSTSRFQGSDRSIPEIAHELGADVILEASVQRSGPTVRLTAQLADGATDRNLWGERLDEGFTVENVFEVQARLVERIADHLGSELTAGERTVIREPATTDPEAFELYVRGRDSWLGLNAATLKRALSYFDEALARDERFGLALAAKADTYLAMEFVGVMPLDQAVGLARDEVEAALAVDPDLAEARTALGHVLLHERNGPQAESELRRAIQLKPSFLEARMFLGMSLLDWGRLDEAEQQTQAALRIDPLSTYGAWGAGLVRLARDDAAGAAEHFRRAVAMDGTWVGHYELAWALAALGDHEQALGEIRLARGMASGALAEEFGLASTAIAFRALAGDTDGARQELDALDRGMESRFALGLAHAALGDLDRAFELWLHETEWTILLPAHFRYGSLPAGVREDPRHAAVLSAIDAQWKWSRESPRAPTPAESPSADRGPSVAVLPFVELGDDATQDYFGAGLSTEIITALSRFPGLAVISRSQTMKYVEGPYDVRQLARSLGGVRYVLEGTVRRSGTTIKVDAWLTSSADGRQVWAQNYEANLTAADIFRTQEELTLEIVNAIATGHGELSRAELARTQRSAPQSFDSYLCVLRAYRYWHAHSPENHLDARDCLEVAVVRDPDYADAWALLAYAYAEEYHHQWNEQPDRYDALQRALETARRAIRMDSSSQVAHGVLALIHSFQGDRERFLVEARTTIQLNPGNSDWLAGMGTAYSQLGFFEEGTALVRQAQALNPTPMPWLFMTLFLDHYHHRRYEEALGEALRTDTSDFRTPLFRAAAYGQLGEEQKAGADLEELAREPATDTLDEIRELLIRRNGYEAGLAAHLLEGLQKAGFE